MKAALRWSLVAAVALAAALAAALVLERPAEVAVSPVTAVEGLAAAEAEAVAAAPAVEPPADEAWMSERRRRIHPNGHRRGMIQVIRSTPAAESKSPQ